jgi:hypothetical protein
MWRTRIQDAIHLCQEHLKTLDANHPNAPELESYIVSGVILLIVSEYEQLIESLFIQRAHSCGDPYVANYIKSTIDQKFRSPDLGKITEILGKFGEDYKKTFSKKVLNTESHTAWDNIMRARHAIVHKKGILNMTLHELSFAYPKTIQVISELKSVLGLS